MLTIYHLILSSDGTFKVSPKNFLQLYTINVLVEQSSSSLVCAFILMGNKAAPTYVRVFQRISGHLNGNNPESIIIDFEQSLYFLSNYFKN